MIGSLKSLKIGSLESEKWGPYRSKPGFLTFSLKKLDKLKIFIKKNVNHLYHHISVNVFA